jgi:hypothetical protein
LSDADRDIQSSSSAFLAEILGFRPEAIKELAEKEGIDLEVLNLLKQHKISAAELRELLGTKQTQKGGIGNDDDTHDAELKNIEQSKDDSDLGDDEEAEDDASPGGNRQSGGLDDSDSGGERQPQGTFAGSNSRKGHSSGGAGKKGDGKPRQNFQTYVGVSNDGDLGDEAELPEDERREIEEAAICFIVEREPLLERTPTNNPGFDLFEGESLENPVRFVEVKAKRGEWNGMVALSEDQFHLAENERERFWLYVVEFTKDAERRRLHRVQDPAGKARYFTFDHGWKSLAEDRDEQQKEHHKE